MRIVLCEGLRQVKRAVILMHRRSHQIHRASRASGAATDGLSGSAQCRPRADIPPALSRRAGACVEGRSGKERALMPVRFDMETRRAYRAAAAGRCVSVGK